jgi:hypothetical protein
MMLVSVVLLKGTLPNSVDATAWGLFLISGSNPMYLFRVSIRVTCARMLDFVGFLRLQYIICKTFSFPLHQ